MHLVRLFVLASVGLSLLTVAGCSQEVFLVETHVTTPSGEEMSDEELASTRRLLAERFYGTAHEEFTFEVENGGYVLTVPTTDTLEAAIEELGYFLGSVDVGIYEAASANDPIITRWLDSLEVPLGTLFKDDQNQHFASNQLLIAQDHHLHLVDEAVFSNLPDYDKYVLLWSTAQQISAHGGDEWILYLYRRNQGEGPVLTNADIAFAAVKDDPQTGQPILEASLTPAGAEVFAEMTTAASADNYRPIGIVIDNEVWTNPSVRSPIPGGNLWITTEKDKLTDVHRIARQLPWEPLPVKLHIRSRQVLPMD